jgi:hypothetical protein
VVAIAAQVDLRMKATEVEDHTVVHMVDNMADHKEVVNMVEIREDQIQEQVDMDKQ